MINADDNFTEQFIKDMQAFESKYPDVHLVVEMNDETNGQYRVEHNQKELFFDRYEDIIKYLKIYD